MATKYLTCAETAKMVRQALKEAFPDVKFSVKSKTYSGGASITVRYMDGPNAAQVEAIAQVFEGAYFDGMIDYKGGLNNMIDGEVVDFGADFIFVNRDYSDAMVQKGIDALYRKYAGNFKLDDKPKATIAEFRTGALYNRQIPKLQESFGIQGALFQQLGKMTDRMKVYSPTAAKVIYLGNDGYSDIGALNPEIANV